MKFQYKLATIVFTIFTLVVLYVRFETALYSWFCDNEDNGAACFVASNLYIEGSDQDTADRYLKKSCKLKYSLACEKLDLPKQIIQP
ncbi:hypothetical protein A9Q84_08640 [Halobacteriovorax marinus]|uniref:Uncharacterized protein n=1 Tax=Halobacteriovorax marinus TaxID=97084 RepID=A0A1Y5FBR1_9BACT|nr:hypothetical protein A9Q84_08640 [Halobacteriovorax marinus]